MSTAPDQPLPSRRELRRREAEAAAANGAPTAVYSDVPPAHQDSTQRQPTVNGETDPRLGAHTGAAAAGNGGQSDGGRRTSRRRQKPEREPLGPVRGTVRTFGELCITAGMVLILFVVWQLWWTDIEANRDNEVLADKLTEDWSNQDPNELPADPDEPVVADPVEKNNAFGIFYIPRFGDDYYRTVAEGVDLEPVLNRMGVGRYPNSAMPGEVGNFSVAGHRVTYGKPFNQIAKLRPGDEIIVQTKDGFYTYTFRNFDIILPDAVEVLAPVPNEPTFKGKDRILTMTACNPMFSARERYIAYAELTDWTPAGDGAPDNIKDSKAYDKVSKNGGA
ncbi:class E sortase [Brevibacterium sandarakinum]|uniref:class E sortase n=1 Tax=Brevibacterium sandarakinum TaxID=629680 RepID=UPI00265121F6|nr:class E sortase [Brevibacterium sandarakinum]MDN5634375.1 class E sortase [Brevibacterium sp.]MDN5657852.1 class E sortase [Brevibacterium sandarakinum]